MLRRPKTLMLIIGLACAFSLQYTNDNLGINTDTTEILDRDLPFLQDRARLLETFPQDDEAILVVVDSDIPERTMQAVEYLGTQFRSEQQQITSVYIPDEGDFFARHGLLYLSKEELVKLTGKLVQAQPFIGALSRDNSLATLLSILGQAINTDTGDVPADLSPVTNGLGAVLRAALLGKDYPLSWEKLIVGEQQDSLTNQRFLLVKPVLDFGALIPAEKSLNRVDAIVRRTREAFPDVRIRLTGEVVLEYDELESVQRSARIASLFSMVLVCTALLIGLRSWKLGLITFVLLLLGLSLTAGFATLAIGQLNLISVSFAVLYIGIGVDYSIQLSLRYQEFLRQGLDQKRALTKAIHRVGPSIALCALTTAVGFFSFVPTAYRGVSELGVIAGGGMFIALAISLTVLPALLTLFPLNPVSVKKSGTMFPAWVYRFPIQHRAPITWAAVLISLAGLGLITQARFDFNPLNLRDPASESVATFRELLEAKQTSPLTLTVLAENKAQALATAERLKQLESVDAAVTIFDFMPEDQQEKLALLQDLPLLMSVGSDAFPPPRRVGAEQQLRALREFQAAIDNSLKVRPGSPLSGELERLRYDLAEYLVALMAKPERERQAMVDNLQRVVLGTLPHTMNRLLKALEPDHVTVETLPGDLSERWLSTDGIYRIQVFPSENLDDHDNLKQFVAEVRAIEPRATGLPVIYLESGNAVVTAFQQALIGALTGITLVLLVVHRNIKDPFLILLPLLMTAVLTGASTVLLDNPFNFANIIVIPLLLGLGVDSGIYILHRLRQMPHREQGVLRTSTARGVVFASLTTLCSFVSMAFTPHLGLASMGLLLSIGLTLMIACTLLVLPALAYPSRKELQP